MFSPHDLENAVNYPAAPAAGLFVDGTDRIIEPDIVGHLNVFQFQIKKVSMSLRTTFALLFGIFLWEIASTFAIQNCVHSKTCDFPSFPTELS
ncbi:MAG TPA: hypothetical protein DD670_20050 [Planctomycetaceae bacterium]|nr:hypothetical protein [Planctomycetaceae bacterium]